MALPKISLTSPAIARFIAVLSIVLVFGYAVHYIFQKRAAFELNRARKECLSKLDSILVFINSDTLRFQDTALRKKRDEWRLDTLQKKHSFSLSIDSLMQVPPAVVQASPSGHYFQTLDSLSLDSLSWDAITVINPDSKKEGYSHQKIAQYDVLRRLFKNNWKELQHGDRIQFDYSIFHNDSVNAPVCSYVALDTSRKFLVQVSYKLGDAKVTVDASRQLMYTKITPFGINWGEVLATAFPVTFTLFFLWLLATIFSGNRQKRLDAALNNSPNAIAVINTDGTVVYTNATFRQWKQEPAEDMQIRDLSNYPGFDKTWSNLLQDIKLQVRDPSVSYWSQMGKKAVQTNLRYDADSGLIISIDTDLSDIVDKWEGLRHSLKNHIIPVGDRLTWLLKYNLNEEEATALIKRSIASIDEAGLLIENLGYDVFQKATPEDYKLIPLDICFTIQDLIEKVFKNSALTYNVNIENQIPESCRIMGSEYMVKLLFENVLFNAIQSCERAGVSDGHIVIRARLSDVAYWEIEVEDNGDLPKGSFEQLLRNAGGIGLSIIQKAVQQLGGQCLGFSVHENQTKSFLFTLKKAPL